MSRMGAFYGLTVGQEIASSIYEASCELSRKEDADCAQGLISRNENASRV